MKDWNLCVWVGLGLLPLFIALAVQATPEQRNSTIGGSGLVAGGGNRNLRRSHRNPKFPLKSEDPRRKLKRNGGKKYIPKS
jgi:hypothetical protein